MAAKKTVKKTIELDPQPVVKPATKKPAIKTATKKPATKTAAKEAAPAPKATKTVTKKATSATKTAKAAPKKQPSFAEIARIAYLNYRSRIENGLPGNSHTDWIEAERQLGVIP